MVEQCVLGALRTRGAPTAEEWCWKLSGTIHPFVLRLLSGWRVGRKAVHAPPAPPGQGWCALYHLPLQRANRASKQTSFWFWSLVLRHYTTFAAAHVNFTLFLESLCCSTLVNYWLALLFKSCASLSMWDFYLKEKMKVPWWGTFSVLFLMQHSM